MKINVGYLNNLTGSVFAACLIALIAGTIIGWTSPVLPKLKKITDNPFGEAISASQASLMTSLMTLGASAGCWVFTLLADKIGRKLVMISLEIPALVGYILMITVHRVEVFYFARILQGFSVGGSFSMYVLYLAEISSKENRGIVMTIPSMLVSGGTLFCYAIGPYVTVTMLNIICIIFPIVYLAVGILFYEETPYFYLMNNKENLARGALRSFRGSNYNPEEDIKEMKAEIEKQRGSNIMDIVETKGYLKALIIGNSLMIGQQLTGINGITMYSESIFNITGSSFSPVICSIILAAIQLFSGALAPFFAKRYNRRTTMTASGIGMICFESILGIYCILRDSGKDLRSINFLPILCLTGFMLSYNFGCGPLCWTVVGEIYPIRVKMISMSISISLYFGAGFFIVQFFDSAVNAFGIGVVFLCFAGFCLSTCLLIKFYVIETKGFTLEQIQDILNGR